MSKSNLLKMLENLENNNIKLEKQLFILSTNKKQLNKYNNLLEKQKELFNTLKNLNLQEENLIQREEEIKEKEKQLTRKEEQLKEKEKQLDELEIRLNTKEEDREKQKEITERQKEIKRIIENTLKHPKNIEPKKFYQDISKLGKSIKEELNEELKQNPDKFIDINQELNSKTSKFFPSAVLANYLQKEGILTLVEKEVTPSSLHNISMKFILNGLINKKKIYVNYDFGPGENHMIIRNNEYRKNFIKKEYDKLSELFRIPKENIVICNFGNDSVQYELLVNENFAKKDKNFDPYINTEPNYENFVNKLKASSESKEYKINVQISPLLEAIKLSTDIFDSRGDKNSGWSQGETRGGMDYDPPLGWSGYGLNVLKKYQNDDWLGNTGEDGEWCVAYLGTNNNFGESLLKLKSLPGTKPAHQNCNNINKKCKNEKVGIGFYVTPKIQIAEDCSTVNDDYKCIFMCRINPIKFRTCDFDYWVVDPNDTDIRPYRLLIKKYS